jgi:hypothetical protein
MGRAGESLIGVDSGYKSEVQGDGTGKIVITIQQMKPAMMVRTIVQWSWGYITAQQDG